MTRRGKQNYKCRDCGRQFVEDPQWKPRDKNDFVLIDLLLLEKLPLAGIARVADVSESWLQSYVNDVYEDMPKAAVVIPKVKGKLTVQMDELWSFVDHKGNKQWVWLRTNAHVSSYCTSGAFPLSHHLQQILVIPSGFESLGVSAALR